MGKRKTPVDKVRVAADALCKAAIAAYNFVDPNATTIDLNATSIQQGDIKPKLRVAIVDYTAATRSKP